MLKRIFLVILIGSGLLSSVVNAQDSIAGPDSIRTNRKALYTALAFEGTYYAGAMFVLQKTWYKGRKVVPFHFFNDNKGYMQVVSLGMLLGLMLKATWDTNVYSMPACRKQKR